MRSIIGLIRSLGLLLTLVAMLLAQMLLAESAFAESGTKPQAKRAQESPYAVLDNMARALVLIENEYVDPVERERLTQGALKGMVAELDPHSAYLPAEDFAIFQGDTEGRFGGVGVEVDFGDQFATVIAPIEGSPAARAGIRSGDRIFAIDGQPVAGKDPMTLVQMMRGAPGTRVTLSIRREGEEKLATLELTREVIEVSSVSGKLLSRGVFYLRIKTFQAGTHSELLEKTAELRRSAGGPAQGLILDLRNNPGGLVSEALAVTDEFLTQGVIFSTRHRGEIIDEARAGRSGALRRGPLVVLVNEYSASAAELVAGALQDNHRAVVVGARTFGKGSVQSIVDLPGGAGLRLTTMRYFTPSGRAIQAQGIEPDVSVQAQYKKDETFGVLREEDLENHLPAQSVDGQSVAEKAPRQAPANPPNGVPQGAGATGSPQGAGAAAPPQTPVQPGGAGELQPGTGTTHLGVADEIPEDPTSGPDFALSMGFQIVTGVLMRH
jgi:carboxyl-terminal processing protease